MKLARIMLPLPIEEPNSELLNPSILGRMVLNYEFSNNELETFSPFREGSIDWNYHHAITVPPYGGYIRFLEYFSGESLPLSIRRVHSHEIVDLINCPQCDHVIDSINYGYALLGDSIYFCRNCELQEGSLYNIVGRTPYVTPTGRRRVFSLPRNNPLGGPIPTPATNLFMNTLRGTESDYIEENLFTGDVRMLTQPNTTILGDSVRSTSYWFGDTLGVRPFILVRLLVVIRDYTRWAVPYPAELSGTLSCFESTTASWGDVMDSLLGAVSPLADEYMYWLTSTYATALGASSNEA